MKTRAIFFTIISVLSMAKAYAQDPEVQHFKFKELPVKNLAPGITRSIASGERATIGYFVFKKGAVVPLHHHENEQYTVILKGSVKIAIQGKDIIVKAGEAIIIPPNVPHEFTSLEDGTIDMDYFAPKRQDWIDGTDTYFTAPKQ